MTSQQQQQHPEVFELKPMVAEVALVKEASTQDVWTWMAKGWEDFRACGWVSGTYAASFVALGLFISFGFYFMELPYLILPALSGFLLVGPALAVGFYHISRLRAEGETPTLKGAFLGFRRNPLGIFGLGMGLVFLFQVWIRISFTIAAISFPGVGPEIADMLTRAVTTMQGINFAIGIGVLGFVFALAVFMTCAFAIPMMIDRRTVLLPAMIASAYAVARNRTAMILWAAVITGVMSLGLLTFTVGLIVTFPLIGHATWHAYRHVFGEDGGRISDDQP